MVTGRDAFYIDDHALLYALLTKYAARNAGQEGWRAGARMTEVYGLERGTRMAMRCLRDGMPLTMESYLLYGEWVDSRGWSKSEVVELSPVYKTRVERCGWYDTWVKYGVLKYGAPYCAIIDFKLVEGFSKELKLEMPSCLPGGDSSCTFCWRGAAFESREEQQTFNARKTQLHDTVRDFLYHTAHLLSVARRVYDASLGVQPAGKILHQALEEYEDAFGRGKKDALLAESQQDFLAV